VEPSGYCDAWNSEAFWKVEFGVWGFRSSFSLRTFADPKVHKLAVFRRGRLGHFNRQMPFGHYFLAHFPPSQPPDCQQGVEDHGSRITYDADTNPKRHQNHVAEVNHCRADPSRKERVPGQAKQEEGDA